MDANQLPVGEARTANEAFQSSIATERPSTGAATEQAITADEIALYDRQIRLWGVKAQEKLRTANILLIGMKALANEIAKNLVLAGIGSLTVVDDEVVTEDDLGAQFFISEEHIGMNRAEAALPQIQKLNPRVRLQALTTPILSQPPSFYTPYTLTIATDLPLSTLSPINASCRLSSRPFYASQSFGLYGYIFADLITHDYIITRAQSNVPTRLGPESTTRSVLASTTRTEDNKVTEFVSKRELYTPLLLANTSPLPPHHLSSLRRKRAVPPLLACLRALWEFQSLTSKPFPGDGQADLKLFTTLATEKHKEMQLPPETLRSEFLRSFLQNLDTELSPVCAFLGGKVAEDVINVVSGKEQPIQNFVLFDGDEFKGPVFAIYPIFPPLEGEGPVGGMMAGAVGAGLGMALGGMGDVVGPVVV